MIFFIRLIAIASLLAFSLCEESVTDISDSSATNLSTSSTSSKVNVNSNAELEKELNALADEELVHEENYSPAEFVQINEESTLEKTEDEIIFETLLSNFNPTDILIPTFDKQSVS